MVFFNVSKRRKTEVSWFQPTVMSSDLSLWGWSTYTYVSLTPQKWSESALGWLRAIWWKCSDYGFSTRWQAWGGERSRRWCTKEVRLGPASYISEYHPTLPGVCHMVSIGTHCISTFNGAKIDFSVFHLVFFGQVEKKNFFFQWSTWMGARGWNLYRR
jgi:hypothetical protein